MVVDFAQTLNLKPLTLNPRPQRMCRVCIYIYILKFIFVLLKSGRRKGSSSPLITNKLVIQPQGSSTRSEVMAELEHLSSLVPGR